MWFLKHRKTGIKGFSLVEIIVVMTIVSVLVAIAVPTALQQRKKSSDASMKADALQIATGMQNALQSWNGTPPADVPLTFATPTWSITYGANTIVSGSVSTGDVVSGTIWADGSYCAQVVNSSGSNNWIIRSDTGQLTSGTCPSTALGGLGSLPTSTTITLPGAPGNLSVINTLGVDNSIDVFWSAVAGATSYLVNVTGITPVTVTAPSVSTNITNIPGGDTTVSVRAVNASGSGQASATNITVLGGTLFSTGVTTPLTAGSGSATLERVQIGTTGLGLGGTSLTSDASTIKFGTNASSATAAWIAGRTDGGVNFYTQSAGGSIINNLSLTPTVNTFNNNLSVSASTTSTSSTTGALTVTGGTGVGGNLYVGGNLVLTGTCTGCSGGASYTAPTIGSTLIPSGATVTTIAGLTLTSPTINGASLSGIFSGTPTFSGAVTFTNAGIVIGLGGSQFSASNGNVIAVANSASVIPLSLKGATSQSADLAQFQDSGANILARVDAYGNGAFANHNASRVKVATTVALASSTYANGTSGIGATLTESTNGILAAIDAYTPVVGDRILVKNQATTFQNGIYSVTSVGTAGAPWVLTRSTDSDTAAKIAIDFIGVDQGATNTGTFWNTNFTSANTVGTTALTYAAFTSGSGAAITVTDDTSTNATYYPSLSLATSGTLSAIKTSSTKLSFNPSTGVLLTAGLKVTSGTIVPGPSIFSDNGANIWLSGNSGVVGIRPISGSDNYSIRVTTSGVVTYSSIGVVSNTLDDGSGNTSVKTLAVTGTSILTGASTFNGGVLFGASQTIASSTAGKATLMPNGDAGGFLINTVADANKGLVIRGNSAIQTADLLQLQDSGSNVLARVDASGNASFANQYSSRVKAASTASLTVTYANGTAGVGATLTNAGAQVAFAIDGYTAVVGDRILIKDQATGFQNGIYTVTNIGSGATNWILTRSTDSDTASKLAAGLTAVDKGIANTGTYWKTSFSSTNIIGTDGMTWTPFTSGTGAAATITDDNSTNASYYLTLSTTNTGSLSAIKTSSAKLTFNPSTGVLSPSALTVTGAAIFNGSLTVNGNTDKVRVRIATAVAGTLATSFANSQTVDGVTLATGDRILIKNQATTSENGIYTVNASGAPTRATDADAASKVSTAFVAIDQGTTLSGTYWYTTFKSTDTVGTTGMNWVAFGTGGGAYTAPTLGSTLIPSGATVSTIASLTLTSSTLTAPTINGATVSGTFSGAVTFANTVTTSVDAVINGLTVGKGGGVISSNSAIGQSALLFNTTGSNNSALGAYALYSNTTGNSDSALGLGALNSNTTGNYNSALGAYVLYSNTTGNSDSALGLGALNSNTTGSNNSAVGVNSLQYNTTGNNNSAVGYGALQANTTGFNNIALGIIAGSTLTTGSNDIIIGQSAQPSSATVSNEITLGNASVTSLRIPGLGLTTTGSTGTGSLVLNTSPTLTTPTLGVATATSINGTIIPTSSSLMVNPMTVQGDLTYGGASGAPTRLPGSATNNYVLTYNTASNTPFWSAPGAGYNAPTIGSTLISSGATVSTIAGLTLTAPTINGATVSGTFSGAVTFANTVTTSVDAVINGLTVGKGGGVISSNSAIGQSALLVNTTGINNSALGLGALNSNTTGNSDSALGLGALNSNTTGSNNSAVGVNSLQYNTTGNNNSAVGVNSLQYNTTGSNNSAVGVNSLQYNTTGNNNIALGSIAGTTLTTGSNDIIIGQNAQPSSATVSNEITLGNGNITSLRIPGIGLNATGTTGTGSFVTNTSPTLTSPTLGVALGTSITTTSDSSFGGIPVGSGSGSITTNVRLGVSTLLANTTGSQNVALGYFALTANIGGSANTAVGTNSLNLLNTGSNNVGIGLGAGGNLTGGINDTLIGNGAVASGANVSNEITLGNASVTSFRIPGLGLTASGVTGTGSFVMGTSPVLVTPNLGTPSFITLTNATGLPISTGISGLGAGVATFLATANSTNLIAAMSGFTTGTGNVVFSTSPTLTTPNITDPKLHIAINPQVGTTYTFVLTDDGKLVTSTNASAQIFSIPTNASVAYPVGTQINIVQLGSAQITVNAVTPGTTSIISNASAPASPKARVQYSSMTLIKLATDQWYVVGDIV